MTGRRRSVPTWYRGRRFRSQLEAHVAALLDHLNLKWEYEPQGYDLPSGKYLPDFRVTVNRNTQFWIEVKGPLPNAREFSVATDVNCFVAPLLIMQGDVPRKISEGTAWIFAVESTDEGNFGTWYMTTTERALAGALIGSGYDEEPGPLKGFEDACRASWNENYSRDPAITAQQETGENQ